MPHHYIKIRKEYYREVEEYYENHHTELAEMGTHDIETFIEELAMMGFRRFVRTEGGG